MRGALNSRGGIVSIEVVINGKSQSLLAQITVAGLLQQLELRGPHVAVEVNEVLVPRTEHSDWQLKDGDRIEVVTLVGGG